MGHKAVVIFDFDNLSAMRADPEGFVRRLEQSLLSHRRTGGSVSMGGCTVANVVWSGHADLSPILKIQDFQALNVTYEDVGPIVAEHRRQVQLDSPN
jgi:hypothetical protein